MPKSKKQPAYLKRAVSYVEYWVPRLRLENWRLEVSTAPDDYEGYAHVVTNVNNLCAHLVVADPKTVNKNGAADACADLEVTVVHELLHVRFAEVLCDLEGKASHANEQGTEMTAIALVAARRGVHPRILAEK